MAADSSTVVCIFVHLLTSTGARSGTALQVFDWSQHSTPHSRLQSLIFAAIYRFPHRRKSRLLSSFFRTYWKTSKSIRCQRNDSMQVYGCSTWHYLFRSETIDGICFRSDFVYFPEPSSLCHRHRNVKSSTIPITQKWYIVCREKTHSDIRRKTAFFSAQYLSVTVAVPPHTPFLMQTVYLSNSSPQQQNRFKVLDK